MEGLIAPHRTAANDARKAEAMPVQDRTVLDVACDGTTAKPGSTDLTGPTESCQDRSEATAGSRSRSGRSVTLQCADQATTEDTTATQMVRSLSMRSEACGDRSEHLLHTTKPLGRVGTRQTRRTRQHRSRKSTYGVSSGQERQREQSRETRKKKTTKDEEKKGASG